MQLTPLNADSSWLLQMGDRKILIDPWLMGSQVDGFAWFSKQWHKESCVSVEKLPSFDGILISHSFTDHCHKETLLKFPSETPIWAAPSAAKYIRSWKYFNTVYSLSSSSPLSTGTLEFKFYPGKRWYDPVHDAVLITDKSKNETLFYAPHGFRIQSLLPTDVTALITTTITYDLPFWLGGTINLGKQHALKLVEATHPKHVIYTHNEHKHAKGLVSILAKTDWNGELKQENGVTIHHPEIAKPIYLN